MKLKFTLSGTTEVNSEWYPNITTLNNLVKIEQEHFETAPEEIISLLEDVKFVVELEG